MEAQRLSYFSGRDGFLWWVGVVEDRIDPMSLGRVRVRVFGYHTSDKTKLATVDLPWAFCIQPCTSASSGGVGTSPTGPIEGTWVIGFWRDPDFLQEPMVFGTIPGYIGPNGAPQGGAPYDYSQGQNREPGKISEKVVIADGVTSEFDLPASSNDSTVLVTKDGVPDKASNSPPSSFMNTEPTSAEFSGGRTYTKNDFPLSNYGTRTANHLNRLIPFARDRIAQGINNFLQTNSGWDMSIGHLSGYRNYAQQQELYNKYKAGKGGKAASPGGSWHNYGVAVDVTIYRPDGSWDDGRRGDSNYTGRARSAFKPFRMKNTVPNDMGHFYPAEFAIEIPQAVRTGKKSVTDFAREKGINV